jgi:predicted NBD/HSP70 family sugar kinase
VYEGFGVSVVSGGRLLEGRRGLAGELGHVTVEPEGKVCGCGNRGCLETVATDAAMARAVSKRVRKELTMPDIVKLAGERKIEVGAELAATLGYLAIGVAGAINVFNPEAVLVCSRMFELGEGVFGEFKKMVEGRAIRPLVEDCQIVKVGPIGPLGAVAVVLDHLAAGVGPVVG